MPAVSRSRKENRRYGTLISACYPLIWGLYNKIEGSDKVIYPGSELSEARMSPLYTPIIVLVQRHSPTRIFIQLFVSLRARTTDI